MNDVLKKALGFASALVLTAGMVLAASPVQASDVDETDVDGRIAALERELVQLKQNQERRNQESALAAEMKGPSFKYSAGKGLTIAAADNNWSITFGQRLQIYTSIWLTNDDPAMGYQNGVIRIRRFRPNINVTSNQGFYEVKWTFSGNTSVAFDGDAYLHFEKMNPWLPTVAYGYNPSFNGNKNNGYGRTEDSPFINALAMGGSQDGSLVLNWGKLPAMGISKINHIAFAVGLDQQDEYGRTPVTAYDKTKETTAPDLKREGGENILSRDGRSMAFGIGIQPMAKSPQMGGFDVSSLKYSFTYEQMKDLYHGVGDIYGPTTQERINFAYVGGKVTGDHTYTYHNVSWSPLKWLGLSAHLATYKGEPDNRLYTAMKYDREASEIRLAAQVWLWGPKSGMMGGSKKEGGIYLSPMYSVTDVDSKGTYGNNVALKDQEGNNSGLAVVYNAPGGWMQIHGVWDQLSCDGEGCPHKQPNEQLATADKGDDKTNVFTLIAEYRF